MARAPAATASTDRAVERTYATNRQAFHDYEVLEVFEAGLALEGTEVKSIRAGRLNLREGYARIRDGEVWLLNVHIAPFEQGNRWNHEPRRPRKLLLHTREIGRMLQKSATAGLTLIPLRVYDYKGKIKLEVALARGKKQYDKRASIAERETKREIERTIKESLGR